MIKILNLLVVLIVYIFIGRYISSYLFNNFDAIIGIIAALILILIPAYFSAIAFNIFNNNGNKHEENS